MLLRSITRHVKDQNWFAVALDFVIVVVGILIAFQITNWSTNNGNRHLEQQYLERLHDEVSDMVTLNQSSVDWDETILERMEQLGGYFIENETDIPLTAEHCVALIQSHIYVTSIVAPSTIEELLSTGRILLISDEKIRSSIINFTQSIAGFEQFRADVQSDRVTLSSRYPSLFTPALTWGGTGCAFEKMKTHPSFPIHFTDNLFRRRHFTESVVVALQQLRIDLHQELDREINISH